MTDRPSGSNPSSLILGISAYYHDSAAVILRDGEIVAAAQEERFSRVRHDEAFPINAVEYCLSEAGCDISRIDALAYYEKPLVKFERLLETYLASVPRGFSSYARSMPVWLKEKLYLKKMIRMALTEHFDVAEQALPELLFADHHRSHAAAAFYPSPHQRAAVLCIDGVGEWETLSAWQGDGNRLDPLFSVRFPHSIGLLYSAFTEYCGFRVNSGEYKLMGLAPLGSPRYVDRIRDELLDLKADGSFRLNMDYFDYCTGAHMISERFSTLFDAPPRAPETGISTIYRDVAASIQQVTEELILSIADHLHRQTGEQNLCLAGGVALNCVANGRLMKESAFDSVWVQPAAGDAGGALGAAKLAWHHQLGRGRAEASDEMRGGLLGPAYSNADIDTALASVGARWKTLSTESLASETAGHLAAGRIVGWFQGRMEFGPRALGSRSILADPRSADMQKHLNLSIKYRESFRPFAPSVSSEQASAYFDLDEPSPYMTRTTAVRSSPHGGDSPPNGASALPAITHADGSARVQTVHKVTNPIYHQLLREFEALTGCAVLVNTSFNVRGEPIVCTPEDAYRCFMRTEMDVLAIGDRLLEKREQPAGYVVGPATREPPRQWQAPSRSELRIFGVLLTVPILAFTLLLAGSGGLLSPWPWLFSSMTSVIALARPEGFDRTFRGWLRVSKVIGSLVNPLVLGMVYLLTIIPTGLLMRLFRHDPLQRRFDSNLQTYYQKIEQETDMKKPY